MNSGCVYFLRTVDGRFVKIGYTTNLRVRITALTGSPIDVELIGWIPGSRRLEAELHRQFIVHHEVREWFRWCDEIEAFLKSCSLKCLSEAPERVHRNLAPGCIKKIRTREGRTVPRNKAEFMHVKAHLTMLNREYAQRQQTDPRISELKTILATMRPYSQKTRGITLGEVLGLIEDERETRG